MAKKKSTVNESALDLIAPQQAIRPFGKDETYMPDRTLELDADTDPQKASKTSTQERTQAQEAIQQNRAALREQLKHEWLANGGSVQNFDVFYEEIRLAYVEKRAKWIPK